MFVLDTNILSAMIRLQPVPEVAAWLDAQPEDMLFTTAISRAEIFAGLAILADGRRRPTLEDAARAMFTEDFAEHVLPFGTEATTAYADSFAERRRAGQPIATLDLMIAAIARSCGATVVTRDTGGFQGCGLMLIDPWAAA
jgi:toxin FitB